MRIIKNLVFNAFDFLNLFVSGLLDLYSEEHGRVFQTDLSRPNE